MFISVIVPCWNEELHLAQCLESLLAQSYPADQYEVILADNQSTDRTVEIAQRYPRVIVVVESKRSSYAARNSGVRIARGQILAFTDADCEVRPDWLERIAMEFKDEQTVLILGGRRFGNESLLLRCMADYEHEKASFVFSQDDASLYYAYTNNLAVLRSAFEACGPFVEISRGGDVVFASKVLHRYGCSAVRFVPQMGIRHLEINRWYGWHHKMWIYGQSYERYHQMSHTRPLSYRNRIAIQWRLIQRKRISLLKMIPVGFSLVLAAGAFALGRAKARLSSARAT
jgi:glycosyltransferase involved in cell wall biosynthesis